MVSNVKLAAVLVSWLGILSQLPAGAASVVQDPVSGTVLARCPDLGEIVGGEAWRASLVNPVLRTSSEVREMALRNRSALDCLASVEWVGGRPDWVDRVAGHLELFLAFADPSTELVDFRRLSDPAVERLREEVGLAPPEGLVFVRYFSSRSRMPDPIQRVFQDPETRAATIGARYIAVLEPTPGIQGSLETTLSHELVHAFLSARLDWSADGARFPSWFHEGMAIYFSDSGRAHMTMDPLNGQLLRIAPTVQYEQYERVFRYLASDLGTGEFHSALREAVEHSDASLVLAAAGASSYEDLRAQAERWWRWWPIPAAWISGPGFGFLAALTILASVGAWRAWRRWQPAVSGSALEIQLNRDLGDAVRQGDARDVRELLRSGADVNATVSGQSVLEWAVRIDDVDVAETLVRGGARVTPEIRRLADVRSGSGAMIRILADAALRYEMPDD